MTITEITANGRQKSFAILADGAAYVFPYAKLRLQPTKDDPIDEVFDPELGNQAFTYRLRSGAEDSVHLDEVLEFAQDPEYLRELLLHELTVEARRGLDESGLGKGKSPSSTS